MPDFDPTSFDLSGLLKQAQVLQEKFKQAQDQVAERTVEGAAGGGMVRVVADGALRLRSLAIDPTLIAANDPSMLQDMIVAAVNDGLRRAQEMVAAEMSKLAPFGANLPGLMSGRS
jgi:DNA-binding YbaB/EbfC family protein